MIVMSNDNAVVEYYRRTSGLQSTPVDMEYDDNRPQKNIPPL